jgi:hypothetical protein
MKNMDLRINCRLIKCLSVIFSLIPDQRSILRTLFNVFLPTELSAVATEAAEGHTTP